MTYDQETRLKMYTNWYPILDIIENKNKKNILEFGCGVGTRKLCEEFKKVYSFETAKDEEWFLKTKTDLKHFDNWDVYFKSFSYYGIDYSDAQLLSSNGSTRDIKPLEKYLNELDNFVNLSDIDVAFVDQGFHNRGETVNYLFSKGVPFIFAHDYNCAPDLYGWNLIDANKFCYKQRGSVVSTVGSWSL